MQRNHAIGEEVVARTDITVERRGRITDAPIKKAQLGVITSRNPSRATTILPSFVLPCFVPNFVRPWNGVEPPFLLTGSSIICGKEAANSEFAA